ncbi:MAG: FAD-binding oxidoreductase [Chloroflexi bacterium]|nr:FAD-binding oxidoreductase [Chloroflexota bacterium]
MSTTADVIVIGGGVHGASIAFHLARRGTKVIVMERAFVGAGATGRSSGLVRMHYDTEADARLAWESFRYFQNWNEMVGGTCGFTRTGFIQLVKTQHVETLKRNTAMHQRIGIPTFLIGQDDLKRLVPHMAVDDVEVAAYEPESGYAMPSDAANALMNAAREKGTRLVQNCSVTGVLLAGGKIAGVQTTQGEFSAPFVVNAAGAWADRINRMVGLDLPYGTWKHDVMMMWRPKEAGVSHPAVIDFPNLMYFRPEGGLTLVGLEDANPQNEDPDGDADHVSEGFVERAVDRICRRMPIMEKGGLHSTHSGYDGITPDQHAIIGTAGPEGFYLDCGHSGTGFKIAPATGLCMSELILDGAARTVDISVFSPKRFAEGKLIKGNYENIWQ